MHGRERRNPLGRRRGAAALLVSAVVAATLLVGASPAFASNSTVTAATGGTGISMDTTSASGGTAAWTTLTGPKITENSSGNIHAGTVTLTAPTGFAFNTAATVTVTVGNGAVFNLTVSAGSCTGSTSSAHATVAASTISINTCGASSIGSDTLTWSGIQVQPTASSGTPSGTIFNSGATIVGVTQGTTSFGSLSTVAGALDHLVLSPSSPSITAGGSQAFTAAGADHWGNSLGDVTSTTTFTISPDGSCTGTSCTATVAGAHTVTGTKSGKTGTATLTVNAGALDHLVLSPSSPSITAGGSQAFTAAGADQYGNSLGDQTASTTFTIAPNGSCTGATCTATLAGAHTVTGTKSGKTGTATLTVNAGALDHLVLSPSSPSITAGGSQAFTAAGADQYGNSLGDQTASTTFTIAPNGSCTVATCTATLAGAHTVTGTKSGKTGTATLTVNAGALDHLVLSPSSPSITAGGSQAFTAAGADQYGNSLGDVTSGTTFTITPNGSCTGATCTATLAGVHTVTGTKSGKTGTATLTVQAAAAANVAVGLAPASITANGSATSIATVTVTDGYGNPRTADTVTLSQNGDVSIGSVTNHGDGTYTATITASTTAGTETITGHDGAITGTATLTEVAGPAANVSVGLAPASITANGSATSTATVTVTDGFGNPRTADTVTLTQNGDVSIGSVTNHGDGTYTATITASTTAGTETITGHDGALTGAATLTEVAGPAANVSVGLAPASITANGSATSTATVTVTDGFGNPRTADTVTLTQNGDVSIGSVTNHGDGTYTATITASTTAGTETITGHDGAITGGATLTEVAGPAANVAVGLAPSSITANGTDTSTATVTVADAFGNPRTGDTVTLSQNGDVSIGSVTNHGDGTYTATITASTTAGNETITGHDGAITGGATLTEVAGPAANVSVGLAPSSITANGTDTSTATVTVADAFGNPRTGDTVTLSQNGDVSIGSVTNHGDGTYTATITASTTAGNETITGHDGAITGGATLTEVAGPAANVSVGLAPASITANGTDTSTATVTVADAFGNPRAGDTVGLATSGDVTIGSVTDQGSGTYTATITASTTAGNETITATDGAASGNAILTENAVVGVITATSVSPSALGQGADGGQWHQSVTINGSNFVNGAAPNFGPGITVSFTTFVSSTQLTAHIIVSGSAATGQRDVSVTNPDSSVSVCSGCFTVNPGPVVTSVTPNVRGAAWAGTATVTGSNFAPGVKLNFGTSVGVTSLTFVDSNTLTVGLSIAAAAVPGPRDVVATNLDAGSIPCSGCFTVTAKPTITGATPASAARGSSAVPVTITGSGFQTGATVTINNGGITIANVVVADPNTITLKLTITSGAPANLRTFTVTNPDGGKGSLAAFTVT